MLNKKSCLAAECLQRYFFLYTTLRGTNNYLGSVRTDFPSCLKAPFTAVSVFC